MGRIFCDKCGTDCTKDYRTGGLFLKHLGGRIYNYLCPSCDEYVCRGAREEARKKNRAIERAKQRARRLL